MREDIQLPKHKHHLNLALTGLYVLQFKNAVDGGYPRDWKFSHREWLNVERYGLIKIGITQWNLFERLDAARRRAWDMNKTGLKIVGFVHVEMRHSYEAWLHHTLHNYRIPQADMDEMGREWFIPSDEVLTFLRDVIEQLKNEGRNKEEIERTFIRLAQIRQSYFGGRLTPPIKAGKDYYPTPLSYDSRFKDNS
jgi:hypothetical protein